MMESTDVRDGDHHTIRRMFNLTGKGSVAAKQHRGVKKNQPGIADRYIARLVATAHITLP